MRKTLFTFYLLLALTFTSSWLKAQCDFQGQVVEPFNDPVCGKLILSYDTWGLLVPADESLLEGIEINEEISFSYDVDGTQIQDCTAGPAINLTCITSLTIPASDCDASFSYAADFDEPAPHVVLIPLHLDDLMHYAWDFGDGTTSSEMVTSHVYDVQGTYEVCLEVYNDDCTTTSCQLLDLNACHASFSYMSDNGAVDFYNASSGNYTHWKWEMGDGNEMQNTVLESYDYGDVNIYTVCLTVWNNNGCSNKFCDYVYTGSDDICEFANCVYPGDTNEDGGANVYDLLPIGVGYGIEGPPRQVDDLDLALDWSAQFAPDWGIETINGNDFKHIDCNGDGEINGEDIEAIEVNYESPTDVFMVQAPGSPVFWLDFEWDTILVNDDTPALIELEADLMAGTSVQPIQDLNGFALQLHFDDEMVATDGILVDYNDNSFFGHSNDIYWMRKNREDDGGEFDLGFTRKGNETTGFGKIATLKFIIIGDVIARNANTSFEVTLTDLVAVNDDGAMLTIGELAPASVYVVNKVTSTHEEWLNEQVQVYPNPVSSLLQVRVEGLHTESAAVYNAIGQKVDEWSTLSNSFELDVTGWQKGIYFLQVQTDQGLANKRIVVQ